MGGDTKEAKEALVKKAKQEIDKAKDRLLHIRNEFLKEVINSPYKRLRRVKL